MARPAVPLPAAVAGLLQEAEEAAPRQLDAAALNVVARLCKAQGVRAAMDAVVDGVQRAMEMEVEGRAVPEEVAEDGGEGPAPAPAPSGSASASASPSPSPPARQTTFIPSLTMGGYISGSDSGGEDDDAEGEAPAAAKKNRRGQRARQQIWEQKFGAQARHLHKGRGESKRGGHSTRGRGNAAAAATAAATATATATTTKTTGEKGKRDDDGPIHPSWEAAKRAKERASAPTVFAGRRVVFD